MVINPHLLRIFYTVSSEGGFSNAATHLCISQPAVSKAVSELERQIGLPLLERGSGRSRKGIHLTEHGQVLFDHAHAIYMLERAAIDDMQARIGMKKGRLTIGASSTIAGYWFRPYLSKLIQRFPDIDLKITTGNTQYIGQQLLDCQIDIGLVEGTLSDPRLLSCHWHDDELCLITSLTSDTYEHDWAQHTWLLREPGSGTREATELWLENQGIIPIRCIEYGSTEGIVRAVAEGLGVSLVSSRVVRESGYADDVSVMPISIRFRPLFIVLLKDRPISPLVEKCYNILMSQS
ncbi:LysR family transcriptional regulator [Aeromonas veronii]|uniref:LysR family transcriptional regulator n=1 Tax=Aeromonas veronii TaxID=654 RepID=UPI003D256043